MEIVIILSTIVIVSIFSVIGIKIGFIKYSQKPRIHNTDDMRELANKIKRK
jgi:hypothetical protein